MAAAGTTSAFLAVGVTGAGGGRSPFSPSKEPGGFGDLLPVQPDPLPRDQMAGDPHEGFPLLAGGLHAALHASAPGHPVGLLRHGPKDGQHKATRPQEAAPAASPPDT